MHFLCIPFLHNAVCQPSPPLLPPYSYLQFYNVFFVVADIRDDGDMGGLEIPTPPEKHMPRYTLLDPREFMSSTKFSRFLRQKYQTNRVLF